MSDLPDIQTVVDSVADGAITIVEVFPRVAENVAAVATTYAAAVKADMENIKSKMPSDPTVIPDTFVKLAGQTVKGGLGFFESIGKGVMETFESVQSQIRRVTG